MLEPGITSHFNIIVSESLHIVPRNGARLQTLDTKSFYCSGL